MTKKNKTTYAIVIDTRGLRCPLPVLKVQKDIKPLTSKQKALIISDDPLAPIDLGHFCDQNNYSFFALNYDDNKNESYFCVEVLKQKALKK